MEEQPFPTDVDEWSWETIQRLRDNEISESAYLEYKQHIAYPEDADIKPSETEWRHDIEREFVAFANSAGGIIVFGMDDDTQPKGVEPPVHDVSLTVQQFVKDTTPTLEIQTSVPIEIPSEETDRILVAVRIFKADRKPVKTSESSYYVRIADHKDPMTREQLQSMFVEADRRQQAVRQLELEISRFINSVEEDVDEVSTPGELPPLETLDEESLREAFRRNTHLFSDEDVQDIAIEVMRTLDEISATKRTFEEGCRNIGRVPSDDYGELNCKTQIKLYDLCRELNSSFRDLEEHTQLQISQ
jgi:DNA-dependent RNA polymerase auxiliary subunit epsilon